MTAGDESVRARTRANMERLGIPAGYGLPSVPPSGVHDTKVVFSDRARCWFAYCVDCTWSLQRDKYDAARTAALAHSASGESS